MNESAKTRTRLLAATSPARSAHPRRRMRHGKKLSSFVPVVSQFQTGTGYGISASRPAGAASGAAEGKVTRSHKATKIPSLRGFVASCEKTTDYVSETGEVVASYAYDAFGRTIAQSGPMADAFPFRFSTKYYDSETGLYYYGRRYYSPDLGRWLNRDPIEEEGGVNLYAFCDNCPLLDVDPYGVSTFVLIYDSIDPMFKAWAEDSYHRILSGSTTRYGSCGFIVEFYHCSSAHTFMVDKNELMVFSNPESFLQTPTTPSPLGSASVISIFKKMVERKYPKTKFSIVGSEEGVSNGRPWDRGWPRPIGYAKRIKVTP